jgi:hypothetical protein
LLSAAEFLRRQGEKCWILTLDRTFHDFDLKRTSKKELPFTLSLDALIQILAVEISGPGFDASCFGPILASIIEYQFEPIRDTYAPEDLAWLLQIEEHCYDLPPEAVVELAREVNRARLTGRSQDDSELRLQIQRSFQAKKSVLRGSLDDAQTKLRISVEESRRTNAILESTRLAYVRTRKPQLLTSARRKLWRSIIVWSIVSAVLAIIAITLTSKVAQGISAFVGILVSALAPAFTTIFHIVQKTIPNYRLELKQIDETIKSEIAAMAQTNDDSK